MSRTTELVKLPGAVAAALYSRKGYLEESDGALTAAEAAEIASLCTAITMTLEMQCSLLNRVAGKPGWNVCYGWMSWGPEMSLVTVHDSTCIVRARAASFNDLFRAMTEAAVVEPIKPGGKGEPNANIG
jgi:roadblock/LC7 domain-containing protein